MIAMHPHDDPIWRRVLDERPVRARMIIAWIHAHRRHRLATYLHLELGDLPVDFHHVHGAVTITIAGDLLGYLRADDLLGAGPS